MEGGGRGNIFHNVQACKKEMYISYISTGYEIKYTIYNNLIKEIIKIDSEQSANT